VPVLLLPALFVEDAELIPLAYHRRFPNARYVMAEKRTPFLSHLKNVPLVREREYTNIIGFPARCAGEEDTFIRFQEKIERMAAGQKIKKCLMWRPVCRV